MQRRYIAGIICVVSFSFFIGLLAIALFHILQQVVVEGKDFYFGHSAEMQTPSLRPILKPMLFTTLAYLANLADVYFADRKLRN